MIKLIKSSFYKEGETKKKLVSFIRNSKKLSFGSECETFERNFASWQGRKHFIFVNSGSSANLAIIQSLLNLGKIKLGDYIGFSALTWSTNVMPIIELGLQPIPIDIELNTLNVSSEKLLAVLKHRKLKALIITNLLGFCGDIDKILEICKKRNILLIEDNCESVGSVYKGKKLGNYSIASTFSFYVGHHMSTIEGGGIATDDEELETMLRVVRAHGWDRNLSFSKQNNMRSLHNVNSTFYSRYTFYDLGYNLRPTELNGLLGNIQLTYIDEIIAKRNRNFLTLAKKLYKNTLKYYPLQFDHMDLVSNFAVPLVCTSQNLRDILVEKCEGRIEIRPIVGGDISRQPFFTKYEKMTLPDNSNAKLVHEQGFYFGNNPELTKEEIQTLLNVFS